jgi:alpha-D-xyloside xylohydrolase
MVPSSRRLPLAAAGLLALLAATGCSSKSATPGPTVTYRTVDLGNGYLASFGSDGSLEVTQAGAKILATAPGVPLLATLQDPEDPSGWHDPTAQTGLAWSPVDPGAVTLSSPTPGQLLIAMPDQGPDTALVALAFADDGAFSTALGERYEHVGANGAVAPMFLTINAAYESGTNDAHVPVPFLVSANGYGAFVASRQAGAFDLGVAEPGVTRAAFEGTSLTATLFFDADPLAVVAAYARLTGLPRRTPLWTLAPMHWRNHWANATTVLASAADYRMRKIPESTVWLDDGWQTSYNSAVLDETVFGDVPTMMQQIAALGYRTMGWSTPYLEKPVGAPADQAQQLYDQAAPAGYFVSQVGGGVWPAVGCCYSHGLGMIDFTSAKATAFWQGVLKSATGIGFDGFKLDYGEDLIPELLNGRLMTLRSDGETERTARTYPLGYHAAYHGALDAVSSDGFVLGRASSYGGQVDVDAIWPGDLDSDFSTRGATSGSVGGLPAAIIAAQTLSVSGFPSFASDTGGYRNNPTGELVIRWAEHTAFTVVMQLYAAGSHLDPWLYDATSGALYTVLARAHMQLVPYLASLTKAAALAGTPTIRPLPLAYPTDAAAITYADAEYMLGPDLLIAPVVESGVTSRTVHFPAGSWVHWFDGTLYTGPTDAEVPSPLGDTPAFVRAGAVVPLYPDGIDTLVAASDPTVVTLAMKQASVEARAFVEGPGAASFEEGSTVTVADASTGVSVAWKPVAPVTSVFLTIDLRKSAIGSSGSLTATLAGGGAIAKVADEATARTTAAPCYATSAAGDMAWVSLSGASTVVLGR